MKVVCMPPQKMFVPILKKEAQKPFILCEYMHDMGNSLGGYGLGYMELLGTVIRCIKVDTFGILKIKQSK